jgi:hypothetical protein
VILTKLNPSASCCNYNYTVLCSSPVTEDVPPRRDWSTHGVPPSVTGLVHSRSVPLHPTSVNGLVHSLSVHSVNALHAYMPTHVCALRWPYPAEFNQCHSRHSAHIANLDRTMKVPESTTCFQAFGCFPHTFTANAASRTFLAGRISLHFASFAAVALSLQWLFRCRTSFTLDSWMLVSQCT